MGLNSDYAAKLRELVAQADQMSETDLLGKALMMTVKWRTQLWINTLVSEGTHIRAGLFAGMDYVVNAAEGALLPRLLGVYERELQPSLRAFASEGLEHVVDIGCAEGYYAVGLARLMPEATVNAYDTNAVARRRCGLLAQANGVADRVVIRDEFYGEEFERYRGTRTLVFIDAEGFEDDILRPDLYPALAGFNLIVETHPMHRPGVIARLIQRFGSSHAITRIDPSIEQAQLPDVILQRAHIDMVLALWEWRAGPTPWLVMRPREERRP